MLRLARALYDRRVPHVLGIYLAAGWGLLEFTTWAADRALVGQGLVNALLAFGILGMPFIAYMAWRSGGGTRPAADRLEDAGTDTASVAVLPFVNRSASEEDAFLSDGITDEITTALARTPGLRVASRTSAYVFQGQTQDIRSIGRALNVRAVLEGSVQRADDRIRVTTQLVDVGDGYQLWSGRYDREFSDLFAIEDEIAGQVVGVLRVLLNQKGRGGHRKVPRADIRAYQHYLRGRQFFYQARRKSLHFARQLFRKAIEIDPDYALAYAALADTISLERTYYPNSDADLEEAERASRRALELDPGLAEAHAALAFVLFMTGRLAEAETEFRTAISLDPQIADARYFFARMRFQQGRMEEAARLFTEAADLREDHDAAFFAGQALEALGHEDQAVIQYRRAVEAGEAHMDLNPDDARAATIRAVALYRVGRKAEGLEWGEKAVEIDPQDAGVRYNAACLFAVAGERDRALELIVEAVEGGFGNREWLERDPDLETIRDDPRFQAVLGRMGRVESPAEDRNP